MPEYSNDELQNALAEMTTRATVLESKVESLEQELARSREWRKSTLVAIVAVALLAILMLGIIAFNAVDDSLQNAMPVGTVGTAVFLV